MNQNPRNNNSRPRSASAPVRRTPAARSVTRSNQPAFGRPVRRVASSAAAKPAARRAAAPARRPVAKPVPTKSTSAKPAPARSAARPTAAKPTPARAAAAKSVSAKPAPTEPLRRRKVPEALPTKSYKESAFEKIRTTVFHRQPTIREIVREPTAGGIIFRMNPQNQDIEILLIQDSKDRWTIPKGHIEPGETAKQTAIREIGEETGLSKIAVLTWLGKIHFKYRRLDKLVLMTTQIYLVHALDDFETLTKENWMKGIKWFKFTDALDAVEYDDIEKLMLIAKKKIRAGEV